MVEELNNQVSTGIKIYLSQPWKLIQTGFLVLTWVTLGFHLELIGPTMLILADNVKVSISGMGTALVFRGAGYIVANILGSVVQNVVKRHSEGLLICAFILPAIAVFVTPFVTSLMLMCVLFFLQGAAQGLTDLGGTNILLTMWGANAAAPLNTAHLGYGIGAICVNLLVRPFLTREVLLNNMNADKVMNSTLSSVITMKANSRIVIPYTITAVLCVLIAIGHIFFYVRELKTQRQKLEVRQVEYAVVSTDPKNVISSDIQATSSPYSPRTCGRGFFQYGLTLSIIYVSYTFFVGANDQTFSKFFFTFLKSKQFNISTSAASWGIILYWLSYTIGRLIGAVISVFLSVNMCLNIVWFGGLCLAVAWSVSVWIMGLTSTSLFILAAATGLVFSPIFPLSFALINQRLNVVPVLLAALLCGTAVGAIIFQQIAGFVMDHTPNHFSTILIVCILMAILLYIASNFIYFFHERKNLSNARPSVTNGAALPPEGLNDEELQMANYLRDQENK